MIELYFWLAMLVIAFLVAFLKGRLSEENPSENLRESIIKGAKLDAEIARLETMTNARKT